MVTEANAAAAQLPAPRRAQIWAMARFVLAWLVLDVVFNLRFPGAEPGPPAWYLLPSLDVTLLLGAFALLGWAGRRAPRGSIALLTGAVVAVRLFRLGDGLVQEAYYRPINLYLDLPLLPDLARLLRSTVKAPTLLLGAVGSLLLLGLLIYLVRAALVCAEWTLTDGARTGGARPRLGFALVILVTAALSPLWRSSAPGGHVGLFGASVVPRLADQVRFATATRDLRAAKAREIAAVQAHLAETASGLENLAGGDVFIFFVESYGATVFTNPHHAARMRQVHEAFAARLATLQMDVVTGQLASPIQGGGSWLAHATFAAGVRIGDGLEFALLRQTEPPPRTMAWFFQRAGYHTILVQPGTTRPWPEGEITGFAQRYYAPQLGYQGPEFEWAPMPDQYVIDYVDRREITPAQLSRQRPPVFVEFALISSHAPWSVQPPVVPWAELGPGGSIYHRVPPVTFPVTWQTLASGGDAYLASLGYDFEILGQYLGRLAGREALVIILGDHQPTAAVTGGPPAPEVPVHVLSRNPALLDAFVKDGFVKGMRPDLALPAPGMETFLADLLRRLSQPRPPGTITAKVRSAEPAVTGTP